MKKLILVTTIAIVFACNKKTAEPQQQMVTNNQTTTVLCDTINCLQATAQGVYTFDPHAYDTLMTGCKVRMTFDGIKDSTAVYGGINNDSLMFYSYKYWYKMTPINFSNTVQTTNSFYNRLSCTKGSIFMAVTMYFKSGKRAIFHI